jgi:hypothetical protein
MRVKGELKNAEAGRPNKPMKLPVACGARSLSPALGPMRRNIVAASGTARPTRYTLRLRNVAVFRYAQEFHDVALKSGSPLVRAYLLGHALELYLKAFLLKSGLKSADLRDKFGHRLDRLLAAAESHDFGQQVHVSPQLRQDIIKLNAVYSTGALRYFSLAFLFTAPTIPSLARLFRFAAVLRKMMRKLVEQGA